MSETYFTSDTHFWHKRMAELRGFKTDTELLTEEMNEELIRNWNSRVQPGDTIYHLGDVSFGNLEHTYEVVSRLRGQIHLILGNHDQVKNGKLSPAIKHCAERGFFKSVQHYKKIKIGQQKIILFHYAQRVWDCSHYGSWQLYGHSHGTLPDDPHALSLDVGVDAFYKWGTLDGYWPVTYDEVRFVMENYKQWRPVDHHGAMSDE